MSWEIIKAPESEMNYLSQLLREGYEPFAVIPDSPHNFIYLKKHEQPKEVIEHTEETVVKAVIPVSKKLVDTMETDVAVRKVLLDNALHKQRHEPKQRASRKATRKSKA